MKKRILLITLIFLFVFAGNTFAAEQTSLKDYLVQLLQNIASSIGKAAISDTISSQSTTSIFKATEIVSDNLSDETNPTIEFWTQAYCPTSTSSYKYVIPTGYKLVSCSYDTKLGTHGGCSACKMAKIKLSKEIAINGVCGTANGTNVSVVPTTNLCSAGTASTVFGNGPFTWNCSGISGGTTTNCSANKTSTACNWSCDEWSSCVNGTQTRICTSSPTGCTGANSNSTSQTCTVISPVNGVCGTANGHNYLSTETSWGNYTQCATGSASATTFPGQDTTQSWSCVGLNGGTPASCSAYRAKSSDVCDMQHVNLCTNQQLLDLINGLVSTNGVCGSLDGTTVSSIPTTNLCSTGTPSVVSGTGPWLWTCAGTNNGTTANCSAKKITIVNGICGTINGTIVSSVPTTNLCIAGTPSTVSGSGPWTWDCSGSGGGIAASCTTIVEEGNTLSKPNPCGAYGDVDKDGNITYKDVELAFNNLETTPLSILDVNLNRRADFADVVMISNYLEGKIDTFDACKAQSTRPLPCYKYGDANNDGIISMKDVDYAFKNLSSVSLQNIDVNGNRRADYSDVVMISNYLDGRITTFDACKWVTMNLVSEWKFDGNINDSVGTNHGVITGGTYKTGSSNCMSSGCISFDGADDYVSIPFSQNMNISSGGSILLWVKASSQNNSYIIGQYPKTGNKSWVITTASTNKMSISLSKDGINTNYSLVPVTNILDNNWHLIGFTLNGNILTAYVDGVKTSSTNISGTVYSSTANLLIGATTPSIGFLTGTIDDARLFNKALSDQEVKDVYDTYKK